MAASLVIVVNSKLYLTDCIQQHPIQHTMKESGKYIKQRHSNNTACNVHVQIQQPPNPTETGNTNYAMQLATASNK